jgi:hypothetical protein
MNTIMKVAVTANQMASAKKAEPARSITAPEKALTHLVSSNPGSPRSANPRS